jgi:hypothetical protein
VCTDKWTRIHLVVVASRSTSCAVVARWAGLVHGRSTFPLGRILATPGVLACVPQEELLAAIARHANGDWGDVDEDDRNSNDAALRDGARLLSAYRTQAGVKFWIITEADRSTTTVLLPEEY